MYSSSWKYFAILTVCLNKTALFEWETVEKCVLSCVEAPSPGPNKLNVGYIHTPAQYQYCKYIQWS